MENWILAVDNNLNNLEETQQEWFKYHVFVRVVKSMQKALRLLMNTDFLLVVIVADTIEYLPHLASSTETYPPTGHFFIS
ncbi:MAG: hypothetical protein APF84_08705 [Gracilibacter sp. BRH_c7a]|nr:MAG: hypothetical protein APF84_08705 [Gracilibacter sp. BRH_c7a]